MLKIGDMFSETICVFNRFYSKNRKGEYINVAACFPLCSQKAVLYFKRTFIPNVQSNFFYFLLGKHNSFTKKEKKGNNVLFVNAAGCVAGLRYLRALP